MKAKEIVEGKAKILVRLDEKISKKMRVFYNPHMRLNRDLAVAILNSTRHKPVIAADLLAGTGIRSIRFLLETKIKGIHINDASIKAYNLIKKNLKLNKIKKRIKVFNQDANLFLLNSKGFSYIDIDPFGSPNPYLDASIKRLSRKGIIAVTATDTSALSGSYKNACLRKYWAVPLRNELMHEIGIRILIRKVQLVGAQFDKALNPIFSHSSDHYMRSYFYCEKSKTKIRGIMKQHAFFLYCRNCLNRKVSSTNNEKCRICKREFSFAGPIWTGTLWDKRVVSKMIKNLNGGLEALRLLDIIKKEANITSVGFYDPAKICSKLKRNTPKKEVLINEIKKKFSASETHFSRSGIRSDIGIEELVKIIKKI